MFKLLNKNHLLALLGFISINSSVMAQDYSYSSNFSEDNCCPSNCNRFYIGAFGGGIYGESTRVTLTGVAFFTEAVGGPLAVNASGNTGKTSAGFGGVQIGYELLQDPYTFCDWSITPAAEIEAYWFKNTKSGHLINPTIRLPEHDFDVTLPIHTGVYLANAVFSFHNCCLGDFTPYVSGGIGAANLNIRGADALQVSPVEAGVNHFNTDRGDSTWAFAVQAKAGLRYNICEQFHIFAEYRFLFLDSSRYIFGATDVPGHVPTTTWNVKVNNTCYNAFAVGVQYDL